MSFRLLHFQLSKSGGFNKIKKKHPDVDIKTIAIDKELTKKKLISPGLGDFGDRFF